MSDDARDDDDRERDEDRAAILARRQRLMVSALAGLALGHAEACREGPHEREGPATMTAAPSIAPTALATAQPCLEATPTSIPVACLSVSVPTPCLSPPVPMACLSRVAPHPCLRPVHRPPPPSGSGAPVACLSWRPPRPSPAGPAAPASCLTVLKKPEPFEQGADRADDRDEESEAK